MDDTQRIEHLKAELDAALRQVGELARANVDLVFERDRAVEQVVLAQRNREAMMMSNVIIHDQFDRARAWARTWKESARLHRATSAWHARDYLWAQRKMLLYWRALRRVVRYTRALRGHGRLALCPDGAQTPLMCGDLAGHRLHCRACGVHLTSALLCPTCGTVYDWADVRALMERMG